MSRRNRWDWDWYDAPPKRPPPKRTKFLQTLWHRAAPYNRRRPVGYKQEFIDGYVPGKSVYPGGADSGGA